MDRRLAPIGQNRDALRTGGSGDRPDIDLGAEHVGEMRDRHQLGLGPNRIDHRLRVQIAGRIHIDRFEHRPLPFTEEMPRYDIGMMLHHAQNNLVASRNSWHRPAIGHEVDPLGRPGIQDNLILIRRIEKPGNRTTHAFVFLGGEV